MNFPLPNYGYHSVSRRFTGMSLEQTRACHNHCVFCSYAKTGHENATMSMEDLSSIVELFPQYSGEVSFTSGEVLTLKNLPERIAVVKRAWPNCYLDITITLNIPCDKSFLQDIFSAGLDNMIISCYGHTPEDYARIHGGNRFSALEHNLALLGALPKNISAKVTLRHFSDAQTLFGIHDAEKKHEQFLRMARKMGITAVDARRYFPWNPPKPVDGHALWELPHPCDIVWGNQARWLYVHYNLDVVPCCFMRNGPVLGNLRQMSLEEIFTGEVYTAFRRAWWEMRPGDIPVCNSCQYYLLYGEQDERDRLAAWQARDVCGRKVVFWGAGEAYRAYKSFFADCEPVAMLLESQEREREREVDGIPLYHPADFLPTLTEPLPLVIFAMPEASPKILRKLKEDYAFYTPSKLIICPANAHIVPPVEPFFQD